MRLSPDPNTFQILCKTQVVPRATGFPGYNGTLHPIGGVCLSSDEPSLHLDSQEQELNPDDHSNLTKMITHRQGLT